MIKPDIRTVIENEGVVLIERGNNHVARCPFHSETQPSFTVFDENYHCFGCGAHGDAISFVRELYGLSFQEALEHLGIENKFLSKREYLKKIKARRTEQQKREKQLRREIQVTEYLVTIVRATKKAVKEIKTINDFEKYGHIHEPVSTWEYQLDLLTNGNEADRAAVCKEYENMEFEPIARLWNSEFNYRKWLNDFLKKRDADEWEINLHFAGCEESREEAFTSG